MSASTQVKAHTTAGPACRAACDQQGDSHPRGGFHQKNKCFLLKWIRRTLQLNGCFISEPEVTPVRRLLLSQRLLLTAGQRWPRSSSSSLSPRVWSSCCNYLPALLPRSPAFSTSTQAMWQLVAAPLWWLCSRETAGKLFSQRQGVYWSERPIHMAMDFCSFSSRTECKITITDNSSE